MDDARRVKIITGDANVLYAEDDDDGIYALVKHDELKRLLAIEETTTMCEDIISVITTAKVTREAMRTMNGVPFLLEPHREYDILEMRLQVTPGDGEKIVAAQFGERLRIVICDPKEA